MMTDIVDKDGLIDENEERQQTLQQQAARDRVDFVKILPFEAAEEIFSYLSARDLRACSSVSVQWHELTNSSLLWRAIAEQAHFRRLGAKNILNKQLLEKEHFTSVESNFLNHFKRFRVPSGCDRLSPMNDWKRIHCQTNFLLYNWERGSYAAHVVPFPKLSFHPRPRMNTTRVIYPSKLPKDTLYLPYQYRHDKMCSRFYILRLDDEPKVVYELDMGVVPIACVNRDCLVFVLRKKIEMLMFDADDEFKTVGELFTAAEYGVQEDYDKRENYFLNMDNSVIVAGFKYTCIKVWCRTTLNLLKTFNLAYKGLYFSYLHFHNSTLYFSTWITQEHLRPEAELKIWELNEDKVHRIPMKREVTKVCSNEKYLLLVTKLNVNINVIEVRERGDFNMVTMAVEQDNSENWGIPTPVALLCGERVLYLEAMTIKVISLNLNAVFVVCKAFSVVQIEQVVGDLLMVRLRDRVEVWDLKKGMRLYTPVLECPMTYDVYCHDTRLVVVKPTNEVKVIGFW